MLDAEKSQNQLADNLLWLHQQINKEANYSMVAAEEEGMVLQLADGSIQGGNTACERILGLSCEQMMGRTSLVDLWQSIHEDGSAFWRETHPAMVALQTGKPCLNVVMGLYKPNGQLIWLLLNSQPLFLAGGTTPYAVVTTFSEIRKSANISAVAETKSVSAGLAEQETDQDISDRKQAEETLRQSEERYRLLADTIPEMVWTTDAEGETNYVNQRWYEYTGLSLEETAGNGWRKILHPDDLEISVQLWTEALQNGTPYEIEHRYFRIADATYRWHLVRALAIKNDQGRILKWFGTCTDIHQQKQIEKERAQILEREKAARLEAETANRIKDEFLAVLSHELRSPLNPILGWAKLLKSRKFDEAATFRALDTIERNAKLQIQLIDDLLDVSRILRGKLCLNFAAFDLAVIVNAAIETVKLAAQDKSIEMNLQIEPNVGKVLCDFNRLQQVVGNLLNNAVKFTPAEGLIDIKVSVAMGQGEFVSPSPSSSHTTSYAQITVTDTGKGIASEFLPHLFEYFGQAHSSITRNHGGLGLGLSIVRHLVELHGGTVTAESPGEEKGATFIVRLPLIEESSK